MTSAAAIVPHFRRQAAYCTTLGSPLTAAVLTTIADLLERARSDGAGAPAWTVALRDWPGDPGAEALAPSVAAALHRAVPTGSASRRDRGGQYVYYLVLASTLKKNYN